VISLHPIETSFEVDPLPEAIHGSVGCHRQIVAAEREMGAFLMAVRSLFGDAEASRAAEDWIELAEQIEAPLVEGIPNWQWITTAAASRLASRRT
jgi:hypothetical protein